MASLRDYFVERRKARRRRFSPSTGASAPRFVSARVRAEGCSGLRHIQIRDFHLLTDLGPDCAGFDLGPTPFELQLGVLGSCLTQSFLHHAAARGIAVERIEIEVTAQIDPLAGTPDQGKFPATPHDIRYTAHLDSPAPADEIARLCDAVERASPILNLLVNPHSVRGAVVHDLGPVPDGAASPN
jgi:uncharacterized OsmC-like protein